MIRTIFERIRQKKRTIPFPGRDPVLPELFRGVPVIDAARCPAGCAACVAACLTGALRRTEQGPAIDLGRCLFCTDCTAACPHGGLKFGTDWKLAARTRADLDFAGGTHPPARMLDAKIQKLFKRSFRLRQVSAGGCNACEADTNVLNTVVFDLSRFGIQFVASPRHADGILVTGPVPQNMWLALKKTYAAVPSPKVVIAVGACAISGGPFIDHAEVHNGVEGLLPVDLYIPGCLPHPITILDGMLRLIGRL
ncbi:MAG: hydrogenase [Planctomycetota bacterium]